MPIPEVLLFKLSLAICVPQSPYLSQAYGCKKFCHQMFCFAASFTDMPETFKRYIQIFMT
jgi:hypothetical protein